MYGDTATMQYTLKEARLKAGLTQQQLAGKADLATSTISQIETDTRKCATHVETASALARALGMEVEAIRWPHGLTTAGHEPHASIDSRTTRTPRATCTSCFMEVSPSGACGC